MIDTPEYALMEQMNREAQAGLRLYKRLADALTSLDLWEMADEYLRANGYYLKPPRHRRLRRRGVSLAPKEIAR